MKFIAIIGLPRSGSTIVCSFFNSLPRSTVSGELFRVIRAQEEHRLEQMVISAEKNNLDIGGIKEVWDNNLKFDPIDFVRRYEDKFDLVFVIFRDPRKHWESISALGHKRSISIAEFIDKYLEFYDLLGGKYVPIVLQRFIANPESYVRKLTGWDIPEKVILQKYSGGGDPHAMVSKRIVKVDHRPDNKSKKLDRLSPVYKSLL